MQKDGKILPVNVILNAFAIRYNANREFTPLDSLNKTTASGHLFTDDYKSAPYWLEGSQELNIPDHELPQYADVVIIGSGYTGLHTALQTIAAGRSTVLIDSSEIGHGCSTRNGGQISPGIDPSEATLSKTHGREKARRLRQEGENALSWIESFVTQESIDCNFERNGLFHAAHTPAHYEQMCREIDHLNKAENIEAFAVPKAEQRSELGTDTYYGGVVYPKHAAIHAAKYHQGLVKKAQTAGVTLLSQCQATSIIRHTERSSNQFSINTGKGTIKSRDVMIATNGYSSQLTPWFHRRVIPIGSYVIASESLPIELVDELFPSNRVVTDSCKVVYYYRAAPDRTRILFGGRVSANETDPTVSAPRLHEQMVRIFPQLKHSKISHSWSGTVGYTFDTMPHTGVHNGLHYAMGYCGSGIAMASYLGMRAGQKIIGNPEGITAFDNLPFPTRPLYRGNPWFLPAAVSWFAAKDKIESKLAAYSARRIT